MSAREGAGQRNEEKESCLGVRSHGFPPAVMSVLARYIPYLAATMFAWTALVVASDAAPVVKTPS